MIVHTFHNEIIVEAKDDISEEVKVIMEKYMVDAFEEFELEVPFKVEIRIQKTWGIEIFDRQKIIRYVMLI